MWCVMVLHRSIANWCGGRCILSICAFCYMCNLFGVTVFHTSIVTCGVDVCLVHVHSVICQTYVVCNGTP